jgi:Sigma-70, region 4
MARDPVLESLDRLEQAVTANADRAARIKRRIEHIRRERAAGRGYREIVTAEEPPLIVQLVTQSATALDQFGVQLRRTEAQALYDEGLTMEQIADLFGVTRQRVSTLLKHGSQ